VWDDADVRFAKLTLTTRRLPGLAATGAALLALSACSSSSLPTLSGFDAVRDQAARTEAAASERATQLAEVATECASCSAALRSVASASHERPLIRIVQVSTQLLHLLPHGIAYRLRLQESMQCLRYKP